MTYETKNDVIAVMVKVVVDLQSEYDAADHDTTAVSFMEKHGENWQAERSRILGEIDGRRTTAIWTLGKVFDAQPEDPRRLRVITKAAEKV